MIGRIPKSLTNFFLLVHARPVEPRFVGIGEAVGAHVGALATQDFRVALRRRRANVLLNESIPERLYEAAACFYLLE